MQPSSCNRTRECQCEDCDGHVDAYGAHWHTCQCRPQEKSTPALALELHKDNVLRLREAVKDLREDVVRVEKGPWDPYWTEEQLKMILGARREELALQESALSWHSKQLSTLIAASRAERDRNLLVKSARERAAEATFNKLQDAEEDALWA
jgi:hypothetical protein